MEREQDNSFTVDTFFNVSSHQWLKPLLHNPTIQQYALFAGGSLFREMIGYRDDTIRDVDMYVIQEDRGYTSEDLYVSKFVQTCIQILNPSHVISGKTTITLYGNIETDSPLQIVLQMATNIRDILNSFDLTNCRIGIYMSLNEWKIHINSEAEHATKHKYIGVVPELVSVRSIQRIQKYAKWLNTNQYKMCNMITNDVIPPKDALMRIHSKEEPCPYYQGHDMISCIHVYLVGKIDIDSFKNMLHYIDSNTHSGDDTKECLVYGIKFNHLKEYGIPDSMVDNTFSNLVVLTPTEYFKKQFRQHFRVKRYWMLYSNAYIQENIDGKSQDIVESLSHLGFERI